MITAELLNKISEQYSTPAFVFDADALKERVRDIRALLGDISLCYSIKANPFLIEPLTDEVDYFEVCSPGELAICEELCVDPAKIIYSGVHKESGDITEAIRYGAAVITAESVRHYSLICDAAARLEKNVSIILRLTSGNQFGMSMEDIKRILSGPSANVTVKGLHYFAGTGRKKIQKQQEEIGKLTETLRDLSEKYNAKLTMLEYGPGLAFPYFTDEDASDTLSPLKMLAPALCRVQNDCALSVEMGRFIASNCGYYLTSICDIKNSDGATWCIVDGGINHVNYLGQMMGMKVPVIRHLRGNDQIDDTDGTDCAICGSLCTTNDILVRSLPLGDPGIGDILVFENIGAYSVTEAIGLFLSRTLPQIIMHQSGTLTLLRDRTESWKLNCDRKR